MRGCGYELAICRIGSLLCCWGIVRRGTDRAVGEAGDAMTIPEVADIMITEGMSLRECRAMLTKHVLEAALRRTHGNKSEAARLLKIHRNSFDRNLATHNVKWQLFRWPRSHRLGLAAPAAG